MSVEKLYQEVKSGRVKLDQLNDEGKAVLRDYMNTRNQEQGKQLVTAAKTVKNTVGKLGTKLGGQLKTAFSDAQKRGQIVQAEQKKQEEERLASRNAYEKWYEDKFSKSFVGKALDKLQGADRAVSNFKSGALDTSSFGTTQAIGKASIKNIPGGEKNLQPILDQRKDSTSYKAGQIAGYLPPAAAADRLVVKLGGKALQKLPKLAQGLIRGISSGALDTTAQEGGDVAFRGGTFDPENIAYGAGAGGLIGGAAPLVKSGLNAGLKPLVRTNLRQSEALEKAASMLPQGPRRGAGAVVTPDIRIRPGQSIPDNANPLSATDDIVRSATEPDFLNSSPGREPKPIKIDEDVIKFNESGLGDADSFASKISNKSAKKDVPFSKRWSKRWEGMRTQFTDDLAPLEGLEKRVRGGKLASAEDSLYKSARMFKGVPEKASQRVEQSLSPVIKMVEDAGYSADDLSKYALAKHARDVNAGGLKSGFTNKEIDDVIRKYETPEMEAAQQALVKVNRDLLDELVDSGVVSKELRDVLNERWKNYIPLFRAFDDEAVEFGSGMSNSLANVASPIKSLKGSERKVIDPLENMVKNIFKSTQAAERNKVASQLTKLAEKDADSKFIRKLNDKEDVGRKNVVNVKVNGENVKYEVEPDVYKALLNMDKESSTMLIRVLSAPATLLRAGATLTPDFALRNPIRDIVQAFVVSKSGFNPITDFGVGLIQSITKGNLYKEWIDNLGAYGNIISMDRNVHRQALEKVLKEPISKKFVNIVSGKSLIRVLRAITDTTESATKVGEYRAALRKGVTKQEAAYRSRDIMDFARAGNSVRTANKIIAFLNANIQGKSKLIRAIKENPAGTITRAFTAITLPTVGIFALNKQFANETQRDTINNAPDWMRNSFWLMAIPGTDVVARIPKPFDLATIFSNLPERALDFVYDNDKEAFDGYLRNSLADSSLPTHISGLLPFIEGMSGHSFFRQGDIVPLREQGLQKSDQYDPVRTTEVGKLLAKGVGMLNGGKGAFGNFASPRVMDNTIQGLTAGLGKYATDAVDVILQKTGVVDRPVAPAKSLENKPFIRSFLVDPNQGGKAMDKFYSTIDKLNQEKASNKLNEKSFGFEKKKEVFLPSDKKSLLDSLEDAADVISDINKEIRTIEKDKQLTALQKKLDIEKLVKERNNIVKNSISNIK